jgi:hypothetical protein
VLLNRLEMNHSGICCKEKEFFFRHWLSFHPADLVFWVDKNYLNLTLQLWKQG